MQTLQEFIDDLTDVLEQEGRDMAAYYNSGRLTDTTYHKIADSITELRSKLSEVLAADPQHGEQIYCSGYPLLYVEGAGLYFIHERETLPIRETVLEEFTTQKRVRLAMLPAPIDLQDAGLMTSNN